MALLLVLWVRKRVKGDEVRSVMSHCIRRCTFLSVLFLLSAKGAKPLPLKLPACFILVVPQHLCLLYSAHLLFSAELFCGEPRGKPLSPMDLLNQDNTSAPEFRTSLSIWRKHIPNSGWVTEWQKLSCDGSIPGLWGGSGHDMITTMLILTALSFLKVSHYNNGSNSLFHISFSCI